MAGLMITAGCNKDDDDNDNQNNPNQNVCAGDANFCVNYDGADIIGNAVLIEINANRMRVYYSVNTAGTLEQIELDIYGNTAGTYAVDTSYAAGTAAVEYFNSATGESASGISGTVTVDTWDPDGTGLSGTFSSSLENGKNMSDGNFVEIKK